jgi:hypothetical protein
MRAKMPSIAISRSGPTCNERNMKALSNGGKLAVTHFAAAAPWRRPTGPIERLTSEPAVRHLTPRGRRWLHKLFISPTPSFFSGKRVRLVYNRGFPWHH